MKMKLLLGSIGAVAILILVSFTNVVGIQSTTSDSVTDSPLFSIRTNKATNNDNRIITSHYLGKGFNALSFPLRENRTALIQKVIDRIRTMDDDTFNRFVDYAVNQINHKDNIKGIDVKKFINNIHLLRESTNNIITYRNTNDEKLTYLYNFAPTACWIPGCILLGALIFIFIFVVVGGHPTVICPPPVNFF